MAATYKMPSIKLKTIKYQLVLAPVFFLIIFVIIFVGNAAVMGIPLSIFAMVIAYIYIYSRATIKNPIAIDWRQSFLIMMMLICVAYDVINLRSYDKLFFLWGICAISIGIIIPNIRSMTVVESKFISFALLSFVSIFMIGSLLFSDENGRANFVFGPNVLYRVFGFFLLLSILSKSLGPVLKFIVAMFAAYGIILTQSRGGLIILAIASITILINSQKKFAGWFFLGIFWILLMALFSDVAVPSMSLSDSRLSITDGMSLNVRLDFMTALPSEITMFGNSYSSFYLNYYYPEFRYPHNVVGELVYFYGTIGIVLSVLLVKKFIGLSISLLRRQSLDAFDIAFIIIFVGAQFSGDLFDNMYLFVYLLGAKKLNKIKHLGRTNAQTHKRSNA